MSNLIFLDFETYYSREYSLRRMTPEEYIRDERFEVIMVALALNDEDPMWITGTHEAIGKKLRQLPWDKLGLVAHNASFDGAILNWVFGIKPRAIFDTLSMSRPLVGPGGRVGLGYLAKRFGVGEKGDEVLQAQGKQRADFSKEELVRYGEYAKTDVDLTRRIFKKILERGFPLEELRIIDLTIRMFTEPVLSLDRDSLLEHMEYLNNTKKKLLMSVAEQMGDEELQVELSLGKPEAIEKMQKKLRSRDVMAGLLEELGVEPPKKVSPTTGKETYAFAKTDAAFQELLEHPDARVQALCSARLGVSSSVEETRTQRFLDIESRGLLPVPLRYYGAHTGRFSGEDKINLQNLPSRGRDAGRLKNAIRPPRGHMFIEADSSQIEARVLAWLSGQEDLVEAFRESRDVYSEAASEIYGRPIDRRRVEIDENGNEFYPDEVEGFVGKTAILSGGYGAGAVSFQSMLRTLGGLEVPIEESKRVIDTYRRTYPRIPALWKTAQKAIPAIAQGRYMELGTDGIIKTTKQGLLLPNGMEIMYPDLQSEMGDRGFVEWTYQGRGRVKIYGGKVVENICQALARIIITTQMLEIAKRYRVVLTVHDSICVIAPIEGTREARDFISEAMRTPPAWAEDLPLDCEVGVGLSYGACEV